MMKRGRRTEILVQGDRSLAGELAAAVVQSHECREIVAPQTGMVMIKMRESAKKSLFYIGEILVTEAKVEIAGKIGIGIVAGMEDELAKNLAIIDAAYQAELSETRTWERRLLEEEQHIIEGRLREQTERLKTKVSFETMEI